MQQQLNIITEYYFINIHATYFSECEFSESQADNRNIYIDR